MNLVDQIAEARIQQAIDRGELRNLPGEGQPLRLEDDSAIPEELRVAYRLLKNAGFLPPELELRREVREAEQLLRQLPESDRSRARARLEWLQLRLAASRRRPSNLLLEEQYRQQLLERLGYWQLPEERRQAFRNRCRRDSMMKSGFHPNSDAKQRQAASYMPGRLLSRGPAMFNTAASSHSRSVAGSMPSSSATTRQGLPICRADLTVNAVPPSSLPRFRISVPSESSTLRWVRVW